MIGKFFLSPESEQSDSAKADSFASRVPPGQYLTKGFPVLTYGQTPKSALKTGNFASGA